MVLYNGLITRLIAPPSALPLSATPHVRHVCLIQRDAMRCDVIVIRCHVMSWYGMVWYGMV